MTERVTVWLVFRSADDGGTRDALHSIHTDPDAAREAAADELGDSDDWYVQDWAVVT